MRSVPIGELLNLAPFRALVKASGVVTKSGATRTVSSSDPVVSYSFGEQSQSHVTSSVPFVSYSFGEQSQSYVTSSDPVVSYSFDEQLQS